MRSCRPRRAPPPSSRKSFHRTSLFPPHAVVAGPATWATWRRMIHPVTPAFPVEGLQDRWARVGPATAAAGPVGVVGGVVSAAIAVVTLTPVESGEMLPAASRAAT